MEIKRVPKSVQVIELLKSTDEILSISDIAKRLNISQPSASVLLNEMFDTEQLDYELVGSTKIPRLIQARRGTRKFLARQRARK